MPLYHGSTVVISNPSTEFSRLNLDFGAGFYLTSIEEQAVRWAKRKSARDMSAPVVNVYNALPAFDQLVKMEFVEANKEWLDFISTCRKGKREAPGVDIIAGPVADDKVFEAVDMYFSKLWDVETTLEVIKLYETNNQICILSDDAILSAIKFVRSYEVQSD